MKLSEMDTRQMATALCQLADPIGNLMSDKKFTEGMAATLKKAEGATVGGQLSAAMKTMLPALLRDHLEDVIAIASALTGKSKGQVAKQRGMETIRDVMDCFDKDLLDFFKSSARSGRTNAEA